MAGCVTRILYYDGGEMSFRTHVVWAKVDDRIVRLRAATDLAALTPGDEMVAVLAVPKTPGKPTPPSPERFTARLGDGEWRGVTSKSLSVGQGHRITLTDRRREVLTNLLTNLSQCFNAGYSKETRGRLFTLAEACGPDRVARGLCDIVQFKGATRPRSIDVALTMLEAELPTLAQLAQDRNDFGRSTSDVLAALQPEVGARPALPLKATTSVHVTVRYAQRALGLVDADTVLAAGEAARRGRDAQAAFAQRLAAKLSTDDARAAFADPVHLLADRAGTARPRFASDGRPSADDRFMVTVTAGAGANAKNLTFVCAAEGLGRSKTGEPEAKVRLVTVLEPSELLGWNADGTVRDSFTRKRSVRRYGAGSWDAMHEDKQSNKDGERVVFEALKLAATRSA